MSLARFNRHFELRWPQDLMNAAHPRTSYIGEPPRTNDGLVDALTEIELVSDPRLEMILRSVDRRDWHWHPLAVQEEFEAYYPDGEFDGNLNDLLSPTCHRSIFNTLQLRPGMSFLNVGSSVGYMNVLAGFLLTHDDINHGIEIRKERVDQAYELLERFLRNSRALSQFDFCVPEFFQADFHSTKPGRCLYDRVLFGMLVATYEQREILENMLKIDGVLVTLADAGLGVKILKIRKQRNSYCAIEEESEFIMGNRYRPILRDELGPFVLPPRIPRSLKELCRGVIRNRIRQTLEVEMPDYAELLVPRPPRPIYRMDPQAARWPGDLPIAERSRWHRIYRNAEAQVLACTLPKFPTGYQPVGKERADSIRNATSKLMWQKIVELELPAGIKRYLNYYHEENSDFNA